LERLTFRPAPVVWRSVRVMGVTRENDRARTIMLDVPEWPGHVAGQHVDIRLTAEDGYQAERSYSIASPPEFDGLELTVERIDDGEVSPYLVDELRAGDEFEIRGPIGGHFTWQVADGGPLLLLGGGSGLVPLMAMLRHRAARHSQVDTRLLVSIRALQDALYRDELMGMVGGAELMIFETLTRVQPSGWDGFARRIDAEMLAAIGPAAAARPRVYICGPTAFVERAADLLVDLGHDPAAISTERFGPSGTPDVSNSEEQAR
jgi:ferredoxin-NADP reductase